MGAEDQPEVGQGVKFWSCLIVKFNLSQYPKPFKIIDASLEDLAFLTEFAEGVFSLWPAFIHIGWKEHGVDLDIACIV